MFNQMNRIIFNILLALSLISCGFIDGNDKMNLILSAENGDLKSVREYLGKVKSPNFISLKGNTPLNTAAHIGHLDVVKYLIDNGASCSYKDQSGRTALQVAIEANNANVVTYLKGLPNC